MKASRLKNRKLPALPLLTYYSLITDKNPGAAVRHTVLIIFIPFSCFFCPLSRNLLTAITRDGWTGRQAGNIPRTLGTPGRDAHRYHPSPEKLRLQLPPLFFLHPLLPELH